MAHQEVGEPRKALARQFAERVHVGDHPIPAALGAKIEGCRIGRDGTAVA